MLREAIVLKQSLNPSTLKPRQQEQGSGEMARKPEDLSSVPSTHIKRLGMVVLSCYWSGAVTSRSYGRASQRLAGLVLTEKY